MRHLFLDHDTETILALGVWASEGGFIQSDDESTENRRPTIGPPSINAIHVIDADFDAAAMGAWENEGGSFPIVRGAHNRPPRDLCD